MFVYLMQSVISNIYKIGYSKEPNKRMRRLNNDWNRFMDGNPPIHSIVWVCHDNDARGLEAELHGRYSDDCIVNLDEYFYFQNVDAVLSSLEDFTGESALLPADRIKSGLEMVDLNTFVNAYPVWAFHKLHVWFQDGFPEQVEISADAQAAINRSIYNSRLDNYVDIG